MPFDDDEATPPPILHDPARGDDPRAREWANREMKLIAELATLRAELGKARMKAARLVLEVARLRRIETKE